MTDGNWDQHQNTGNHSTEIHSNGDCVDVSSWESTGNTVDTAWSKQLVVKKMFLYKKTITLVNAVGRVDCRCRTHSQPEEESWPRSRVYGCSADDEQKDAYLKGKCDDNAKTEVGAFCIDEQVQQLKKDVRRFRGDSEIA